MPDELTPIEQWTAVWQEIAARRDAGRSAATEVVGIAGGVAAGKSTAASTLSLQSAGSVTVLAMDDFLLSNHQLAERGWTGEKGFPHTYDVDGALRCLDALHAGEPVEAPVYSHERYDIVAEHRQLLSPADTIVIEGLHVLGDDRLRDALDWSVFLDIDLDIARDRFLRRFRSLRAAAVDDPRSFYRWALDMDDASSEGLVAELWDDINVPNHQRFIAGTRRWATFVVTGGVDGALVVEGNDDPSRS